ncbi:MAG TPA: arginine decarboxylase, partial [Planctomycetaceae bacterium]|nr:arginine decarboxylase [Planctomycetaceae bacterium]HBC61816.1 arginine decarboxylase [Planctomycetaceae bacterium]
MIDESPLHWTTVDASEMYEVPRWGNGYFSVNSRGNVMVHPDRNTTRGIDLKDLVERLQMRGLDVPVLLRFNGIIRDRLYVLHKAFSDAIREHSYRGKYSCVYPIKVNQ